MLPRGFQDGMPLSTSGYGNVFGLWPAERAPRDFDEAARIANSGFSKALHLELRRAGLLLMPSPYGRLYLSFDHTDAVVEEMKAAFEQAVGRLAEVLL